MLEGLNLLLVLLSSQLYNPCACGGEEEGGVGISGGNGDNQVSSFVTSAEEDASLARVLAQQTTAYHAALSANQVTPVVVLVGGVLLLNRLIG